MLSAFFNLNLHFLLVERFTQSHGLEINMENAKQLKSLAFGNAVQMGKKHLSFTARVDMHSMDTTKVGTMKH